jgi:outer membrane protein
MKQITTSLIIRIFSTFFVVVSILPMSVYSLDLSEAINLALKNDPEYLSAKESLNASREKLDQGRAPLLPNLSGNFSNSQNYPSSGNSLNTSTYSLSVSQVIFNHQLNATQKQSVLTVKEAKANFENTKQNILLKITSAYFDVLNAQDDLKTVEAEKTAVAEQLEFAKRNFEVGTSTITDQQEAQARFDLIRATEIRNRNDLAIKRTNLEKMLLVTIPDYINGIGNSIYVERPFVSDPKEWMKIARNKNFSIKAASARLETARIELKKSQKYYLPSVSASASISRIDSNPSTSSSNGSETLSLNVTIPIYEGGIFKSEIREAIANFNKAQHSLDLSLLNSDRTAAKSYRNFIAGLAQVEALEAAEKSSKVALESNRLGYEVGVRINIDVLNAQKQLFSSQRDLSKARYAALAAGLELKASIGELKIEEIDLISNLIKQSSTK